MKQLNVSQLEQVSGGVDPFVVAIGGISLVNLFWNMAQDRDIADLEDSVFSSLMLGLYNDKQLQLLPHYDEVANITPYELLTS